MKNSLRLPCLFFLTFLTFTSGFMDLGSANEDTYEDPYSFSKFRDNDSTNWGEIDSPISDYNIWGYTGKSYNFTVNYSALSPDDNATMVFYWDCKNNLSYHTFFSMNDKNYQDKTKSKTRTCNNTWDKIGTYFICVGIIENTTPVYFSYWVPIEIKNNTIIEVQNISMMDEKKGFEGNSSDHLYNNNSTYCGYVDNDYSFSVKLNAISLGEADNRTINETTTVIYWNYSSLEENESDNSILGGNAYWNYSSSAENESENRKLENVYWNYSSSAGNESEDRIYVTWNENFIHEWDETGKKNISATTYHWDPLDGNEIYTNTNNTSILIVRDPKNFFSSSSSYLSPIIGGFSNLQNKGLLLSVLGLIIFYFTYTRNNVPVKISLFGLKPFYLRSVNSFTGTLTFITGMYLYFVFGRCPWDIPIVGSLKGLKWLSDMYFGILYYEYTKPLLGISSLLGIPYLSILLGLIDVLTLSLIIHLIVHLIAISLHKGKLKFEKPSRKKNYSASAQPKQGDYSIEETKHYDN